ncbi:MAG: hypothetical protein JJ974_03145 [Phycisphaerales bacterium]|nr:hypothetical protein [Phycisphaerales bacterium]
MVAKKYILWTFLSLVVLAMLTGIAAVVLPRGWVDDEVMITIFIVGAYSLGGLIVVVLGGNKGTDGRKQRWTLHIATATIALSMTLFITIIWIESILSWGWEQFFWKSGAVCLTIGIAFVHRLIVRPLSCALLSFRVAKRVALITGALTATIIVFAFINDGFGQYDELMVRILAISGILTAGTTIAAGALAFFAPKPGEDEEGTFASSIPIEIDCPRCQSHITARSNKESRCPTCRLQVRIEIKEPRCECGYLLYKLETDLCPECGKPIPESEQWGGELNASTAAQSASDDPDQTPSS